jgi:glutathione S-transferase
MPYVSGARFLSIAFSEPPQAMIEEFQKRGNAALQGMEQHLATRPFLVADRYTIADIGLYAYTHVAGEGGFDLTAYPAISGWLERVADQPGYVPMTA